MSFKYKLSVCISVKNEAKYMPEFIEHYVNQGVDHFYIVNNNSSDNIEEMVQSCKHKDMITFITDNRDVNIYIDVSATEHQKAIWNDNIYPLIVKETEWAIIIDADEFMYGKNGHTIKTYLSTLSDHINCVYVIWNLMLPNKDENNNVIKNFSIKQPSKRLNYDLISDVHLSMQRFSNFGKSIIKPAMINPNYKIWVHKQITTNTLTNYNIFFEYPTSDNINGHEWSEENYKKTNITLNHYPIRDLNDYEKRKSHLQYYFKSIFTNTMFLMMELEDKYLIEDNEINTLNIIN